MSKNSVYIKWETLEDKKCLTFKFQGKLTAQVAQEALLQWNEEFEKDKEGGVCMLWDCTNMTGWDMSSRIQWQKALKKHKMRISRIWIISNSPKVKLGAQMIIAFTSYPIKIVPTRIALEEYLKQKAEVQP